MLLVDWSQHGPGIPGQRWGSQRPKGLQLPAEAQGLGVPSRGLGQALSLWKEVQGSDGILVCRPEGPGNKG